MNTCWFNGDTECGSRVMEPCKIKNCFQAVVLVCCGFLLLPFVCMLLFVVRCFLFVCGLWFVVCWLADWLDF